MIPGRAREVIETALPLAALLLLLFLGALTLRPFLPALLWGAILSVSLYPAHRRLVGRLGGRRSLATLATALALCVVMLLPIAGLARALIAFIPEALTWLESSGGPAFLPGPPSTGVLGLAEAEARSVWDAFLGDLDAVRKQFGANVQPVASWLLSEGRVVGTFVLEFALGVVIASILLNNAERIAAQLGRFAHRVGGDFGAETVSRAVLTIRSTVFGILGSAAAQAAVASVGYVVVGAPHWPILALATLLLGILQVGPILIWAPIAIWLWLAGEVGLAIFLTAWGLVAVGLTDNLVKTAVVSRGAKVPAILAFLGALGGLITWGIVGIFLGPVIVAVCYQLILRWLQDEAPAQPG